MVFNCSFRSEFPDFGDLFLAHLYERCPFLIPCYFAKKEGMSEEDYYKKLGYLYQDSQVEDQVNHRCLHFSKILQWDKMSLRCLKNEIIFRAIILRSLIRRGSCFICLFKILYGPGSTRTSLGLGKIQYQCHLTKPYWTKLGFYVLTLPGAPFPYSWRGSA